MPIVHDITLYSLLYQAKEYVIEIRKKNTNDHVFLILFRLLLTYPNTYLFDSLLAASCINIFLPDYELNLSFSSITVPAWKNNSCFCDSVCVALFASTRAFDILFDKNIEQRNKYIKDTILPLQDQNKFAVKLIANGFEPELQEDDRKEIQSFLQKIAQAIRSPNGDAVTLQKDVEKLRVSMSVYLPSINDTRSSDAAEFLEGIITGLGFTNWFIPYSIQEIIYEFKNPYVPPYNILELSQLSLIFFMDSSQKHSVNLQDLLYSLQRNIEFEKDVIPNSIQAHHEKYLPGSTKNISASSVLIKNVRERIRLNTLPIVLIIRISRYGQINNSLIIDRKIYRVRSIYDGTKNYRVSAVICRTGEQKLGSDTHYYCYVSRNDNDLNWLYFDGRGRSSIEHSFNNPQIRDESFLVILTQIANV